ncbi:uncharacterized protein LOC111519648 [Drosophila willistoni]|uniref:uncharacterized protein LOC111519648 n=1 Tax=Drosophila willistoni TaxID=7260 RepID=UPI000C26CC13|nr:uncharacterized protein LOC111519648 [Drosophila willistoni]
MAKIATSWITIMERIIYHARGPNMVWYGCGIIFRSLRKPHPLFDFLQKKKSEKIGSSRVDSILGLKQYFNMENIDPNTSPLDYWKISTDNVFKRCVKKFCVPATSTESEQMFSKAGHVVNEKRSCLKSQQVDMLLFINKNDWIRMIGKE